MTISMTVILIAVNVLTFFIIEILGDSESAQFMVQSGAIYPPYILEDGEYWRLLTATFLHFGGSHLLNNMVMLGAAGQILERALGKWKFLLLYLVAGIGGSALSYWEMVHTGEYAVAAGASGAVFGIIGALVCLGVLGVLGCSLVCLGAPLCAWVCLVCLGVLGEHRCALVCLVFLGEHRCASVCLGVLGAPW